MEKTQEIAHILDMYETLLSNYTNEPESNKASESELELEREFQSAKHHIVELNKKVSWLRSKRDEYRNLLKKSEELVAQKKLHVENANLKLENRDLNINFLKMELEKANHELKLITLAKRKAEEKIELQEKEKNSLQYELENRDEKLNFLKLMADQDRLRTEKLEKKLSAQFKDIEILENEKDTLRKELLNLQRENNVFLQDKQKADFKACLIKNSPFSYFLFRLGNKLLTISNRTMHRSGYVKLLRKKFRSVEGSYLKQNPDLSKEDWLVHIINHGFIERRLNTDIASDDMKKLNKELAKFESWKVKND